MKYNKFHRTKIKKSEDKYLLSLGYSGADEDEPDEDTSSSSEEDEGFMGFNLGDSDDSTTTDDE